MDLQLLAQYRQRFGSLPNRHIMTSQKLPDGRSLDEGLKLALQNGIPFPPEWTDQGLNPMANMSRLEGAEPSPGS